MNLQKSQRQRLVDGLRSVLGQIHVVSNTMITTDSAPFFDGLLRGLEKPAREALLRYVSDQPLYDFISDYLWRRLKPIYERGASRIALSALPGLDLDALAEEITAAIESLPWSYVFAIEVPLAQALPKSFVWSLGGDIGLARGAKIATRFRPNPSGPPNSRLLTLFPEAGAPRAHLLVGVEGFVESLDGTRPYHLGLDRLKSVLGLMMAIGLVTWSPEWDREEQKVKVAICRRQTDGLYQHIDTTSFGPDDNEMIMGLVLSARPDLATSGAWGQSIGVHINAISHVMRADPSTRDRILLGAQWYFESQRGGNQLLNFVQTMVCLEILVGEELKGDQAKLGISELIRNRVAYLIGRDMAERNQILETFGAIYKVRSEIVHRGQTRLSKAEAGYHQTLRDYCARVIRAEIALLAVGDDLRLDGWLDDQRDDTRAEPIAGVFDPPIDIESLLGRPGARRR